jgi:hypothetical protein
MTRSRDTASIIPTVDAKGDLLVGTADNTIDNLSPGTNGQVLTANSATATGLQWNDAPSGNYIINGAFDIWQRGTTFSGISYNADRWSTTISTQSVTRSDDAPEGFEYSIDVVRNTGTVNGVRTKIESSDSKDLVGKTVTLSFWAKNIGSPVQVSAILSFPTAKDNFTSVTLVEQLLVANPMSTSWTRYYVTFSNLPTGVSDGLEIQIAAQTLSLGTNYNHRMTGVQLEVGTSPTVFKRNSPSIQAELAACQRYYWRITCPSSTTFGFTNLAYYTTANAYGFMPTPVIMRIPPTAIEFSSLGHFSVASGGGVRAVSSLALYGILTTHAIGILAVSAGAVAGASGWLETAIPGAFLGFSAEL